MRRGKEIGPSGKTGFATGPHLHFQIDKDTAPWHPYWPFSWTEAKSAGMNTTQAINAGLHQERGYEYTVHPMLFVQGNLPVVAQKPSNAVKVATNETYAERSKTLRQRRQDERLARHQATAATSPVVIQPVTVASASEARVAIGSGVKSVSIQHARTFTERSWVTVRITPLDENGYETSPDGLADDVYLRTAFGDAQFKPSVLTSLDFSGDGTAEVQMLPFGRRTVQILVAPLNVIGPPMQYKE